jgi:predicted phage tail protein
VTWTAPASGFTPNGYKIFRNTSNSAGGATLLATLASLSFNDTTAIPGTTYWYWVKAFTSIAGDGMFSNGDSGFRAAPPNAPMSVSATDGLYADKVIVTWTAPASGFTPNGYKIFRNTSNSAGGATLLGTLASSPFTDTTGTPGTTYWYWVKAFTNIAGDGNFSNADSGYRAAPPNAPTSVSATDGQYTDKIVVTWTPATNGLTPTGYKVFRNTSNNSSGATLVGTAASSPFNDTTATVGTTYWYWVKAYITIGGDSATSSTDSGYRAIASVSPPTSPPAPPSTPPVVPPLSPRAVTAR